MTSQINTNGINVNYPVPGQNNSSQGFRDNFAQIVNDLNIAGNEITNLQNNVVLKAALANSVLNNDMANTLISNASTRSFRSTTYNLGNSLAGTVLVDVSAGDVQYGSVTSNVTLQLGGWAPTNTQSNVQLRLTFANANATVALPNACVSSNNNFGVTLLENVSYIGNVAYITPPANTQVLTYILSSLDCGNTITMTPINRPFESTQIQSRTIIPTGVPGDQNGAVAVGPGYNQLNIVSTNSTGNIFTTSSQDSTSQLFTDLPVCFTGVSIDSNVTIGTQYYVRNVVSGNTFTVSTTVGGSNLALAGGTGNMYANPVNYMYIATGSYDASETVVYTPSVSAIYTTGNITITPTNSLIVNSPIIFTGNVDTANTGIVAGNAYYIKSIGAASGTANITVSQSRTNGVAGTTTTINANSTSLTANAQVYIGDDIWRRVPLTAW